jgi:hypothetical protein
LFNGYNAPGFTGKKLASNSEEKNENEWYYKNSTWVFVIIISSDIPSIKYFLLS